MTIVNNFTDIDKINRTIFFGDNLDILREKFPNVGGYFDLIYLDPPFNSKRKYNVLFENKNEENNVAQSHAFEDTWNWNTIGVEENFNKLIINKENIKISDLMSGLETVIGKNGTLAYLSMMTSRLIELHRVLKSTGSIYLHCDPTASHYLKIVMDTIFGEENFRDEIIWHYTKMNNTTQGWIQNHDVILFYTKSSDYIFNIQYSEEESALYSRLVKLIDKDNKLRWYKAKTVKQQLLDSYISSTKKRIGRELVDSDIIIDFESKGKKKFDNVWYIPIIKGNSKEFLGYQTQKPEALMKLIIEASSNKNDMILDPFCGCGTTLAVAEKLDRKWVGIDITPLAIDIIKKRLNKHFADRFKLQNIQIKIDGLPKDMNSAITLAEKCGVNGRFDFQYWILGLLNAMPTKNKSKDNKKGKDEGIDGIIFFKEDNEIKKLIISVKSGKNPSVREIRDLNGVITREKAVGGLFVTLYEPTKDMKKEATISGTYNFYNKKFQKIQIVMVKDLLENKNPDIPHTQEPVYKEAVKVPIQLSDYNPVNEDMFA